MSPRNYNGHRRPKVGIIMPAYNEGYTISNTIYEINDQIIKKLPGTRLLVFEDGSRDNTKEVLKELEKRYNWLEVHTGPERLGYPKAVKRAFASVSSTDYDYLFFTDSDGQYYPTDFFKLLSIMQKGEVDMVVAQRINRAEPIYRRVLSKGLAIIERSLFNISYSDVTSAFRIMDAEVGKRIAREVKFSKYNFWLEFTARASMEDVKTACVSVNYRERKDGGTSKVYSLRRIPKIVANEFSALIKTKMEGRANK